MRNLQAAGYTRLITDWLIGINFTSVATLKYGNGKLLNIGRVILPTVKLVYDRDMEIKNFVPKTYFEIEGNFKCTNGTYKGKLVKGKETRDWSKVYIPILMGLTSGKSCEEIQKYINSWKNQSCNNRTKSFYQRKLVFEEEK